MEEQPEVATGAGPLAGGAVVEVHRVSRSRRCADDPALAWPGCGADWSGSVLDGQVLGGGDGVALETSRSDPGGGG